jgi:hypothetical protein
MLTLTWFFYHIYVIIFISCCDEFRNWCATTVSPLMEGRLCVRNNYFLIIKPTRCTNFLKFYSWNETLRVSDSSSVHHQEFFTVHTAMVHVIQFCRQLASRIRMELISILTLLTRWHTPLLCVQWKTPDDGQRNCPKHVEFNTKINLRS